MANQINFIFILYVIVTPAVNKPPALEEKRTYNYNGYGQAAFIICVSGYLSFTR